MGYLNIKIELLNGLDMVKKFPSIKKSLSAFLLGEEGRISKESVLKMGVIFGAAALSTGILSKDVNAQHSHSLYTSHTEVPTYQVTGYHNHHASHSSHSAHSNHGSHNSAW